jgi:hypothetical protein
MVRPVYETEQDRANERFVMDEIKRTRGWLSYATPTLSCVDLIVTSGDRIVGFVEIRTRNMNFGTYDDVIFSAKKMESIIELSAITHLPTYLMLNLTDGIFVWGCPKSMSNIVIRKGGSTRRNDPLDIEQVCHLPWSNFRRLE